MAANKPVTMGIPFAEGAYVSGTEFVVQKGDGTPIPTQWNELATWRTDGSVLHGLCTFLTPDAGNNSGTFQIVPGTAETGTAVSKANVSATAFDAVASATIGGTTYSLSAADLLDGTVTPVLDYTHFSGPICSTFVLGAFLRNGATPHPHLFCRFEIRAYKILGSVSSVRCEVLVDNRTCVTSGLTDRDAAPLSMSIGGSVVNSETIRLYAGRHWRVRDWWGSDPEIFAAVGGTYLQDTKLAPKIRDDVPPTSEATLAGMSQSTPWNGMAGLVTTGSGGGSKPHIGYLNRYDGSYLLTSDERALVASEAFLDGLGASTNDYSSGDRDDQFWCHRHETTGLPFRFDQPGQEFYGPTSTNAPNKFASASSTQVEDGSKNGFNAAHAPATAGTIPYLLTGNYFCLEMSQFYGNGALFAVDYYAALYSGGWPRSLTNRGEVRDKAWSLSLLSNAAVTTPSNHPLRSYFLDAAESQPAIWQATTGTHRGATSYEQIGYIYQGGFHPYGDGIAPWMNDYVAYAVGRCIEMGISGWDTADLYEWMAGFNVARFSDGSNGYCINNAGIYDLRYAPTSGGTPYVSIGEMWTGQHGSFSCDYSANAGIGAENLEQYGAYATGALGLHASLGVPGADAAWTRALNTRNPLYSTQDEGDLPKWCIGKR